MNGYKLEDFKTWLEASKASQGGMEEYWEYFLSWYEENPDIWEATVERGMTSAGYKCIKFEEWNYYDKEIENLYNTIFTWKREVDSNQSKKHLSGYEQQKVLSSQITGCWTNQVDSNRGSLITHGSLRHYEDYVPVVEQTEEEIELRKENSQLKFEINQEKTKNQENQEKIQSLEQKNMDLKSKCRKQEEQLEKMTTLQQQLKLAQDRIKELEKELGITIQTSEKSAQTEIEWEEEVKQKDLKIEELKQKLAKQKKPIQSLNSTFKDASWASLSIEMKNSKGSLSPSQIKAREIAKKQEQSAQIQTSLPPKNS